MSLNGGIAVVLSTSVIAAAMLPALQAFTKLL